MKKTNKQKNLSSFREYFCLYLIRKFRNVEYLEKVICVREDLIIILGKENHRFLETMISGVFSCFTVSASTKIFLIPLRPDGFRF